MAMGRDRDRDSFVSNYSINNREAVESEARMCSAKTRESNKVATEVNMMMMKVLLVWFT